MSEDILIFDPYNRQFVTDPYPLYARLRRENPVHRNALGFCVFSRHADIQTILRDKRFSSNGANIDPQYLSPEAVRSFQRDEVVVEGMEEMAPFLFKDPPDHTRLRGLVAKAFTPRVVEELRPKCDAIVDELLDAAFEAGEVDLVEALAYPLPVQIISEMLVIPEEDRFRFKEWSEALARGLDPDFILTEEQTTQRFAGLFSFVQYFTGLIEERRKNLGDDLLSLLISVQEEGDKLTHLELLSTCVLLLVAGHETTVNLLSGGARALVENPGELAKLRHDPEIVRNGVEELLRYISPVQWTGRNATEDIEVGGTVVRKGEFALMLVGSANRDPEVFDDPESLNLSRDNVNHLGFGFGIHHCLGAPLARLEASAALPTLLRRSKSIDLLDDGPDYKENLVLRGLATLRVRLTPA